jgi:excisionase family DNA binding protein
VNGEGRRQKGAGGTETGRDARRTPALSPARKGSADAGQVKLPAAPICVTKPEVARLLEVSVRTVTRLMRNGALPYLRLGRAVRFRLEDVQRQLNEQCLVQEGRMKDECRTPHPDPLPRAEREDTRRRRRSLSTINHTPSTNS